jgi:TolA-binding protein
VTGGWVIVRTGPDPRERVSAEELIRNAQVLVGYGQTARAAAILEEASKTYPFNQQLAKMLAQIRAGER